MDRPTMWLASRLSDEISNQLGNATFSDNSRPYLGKARNHLAETARLMGYTLMPIQDAQSAHEAHEARVLGLNLDASGNIIGRDQHV